MFFLRSESCVCICWKVRVYLFFRDLRIVCVYVVRVVFWWVFGNSEVVVIIGVLILCKLFC